MFGKEKKQNERIEMLERRVFLLESQMDQQRAASAASIAKPARRSAAKKEE